jgi:hypothetical protein
MSELRNAEWGRTLADVERAVDDCLAALERYESAFAGVLSGRPAEPEAKPVAEPEEADHGWDRLLATAERHADPVDKLLAEHERVWGHWCETYSAWRRSLEQPPS